MLGVLYFLKIESMYNHLPLEPYKNDNVMMMMMTMTMAMMS